MANDQRWRFGPFEVDAAEHRLLRDGEPVAVTRKAFALLAELLRRPGRLITKAELFETVWAGTIVTDAALSRVIRELRVALGDDAAAPRYIATAHGLGFRFVAVVAARSGTSNAAAALDSPREPRPEGGLVRRDTELVELDRALASSRAGKRSIVFVTGEAGIGKTALVEAFLEKHNADADLWMAQGRCIEQYGTGEAYLPILEALEALARQAGAEALRNVLARYSPAWLTLLPWLAHDADPALPPRNPAITADRMLREIAQALEVLAAERPIVLWLEDLHWSDPSTLAVVSFLAGRREPARLLLIATFRPGDAHAADTPLRGLVAQLRQRKQAHELALQRLDVDAVQTYLALRFDSVRSETLRELGAFVHQRTDGNALFAVAMVDDLVRRGLLAPSPDGCRLTTPLSGLGDVLPDSLRRLVHDDIDRLSDTDRRLVEAAAVAGVDFSAAAVAAALETDIATIEDRCTRLAEQGRLLRGRPATTWPDGTVASGFGFLHALYWRGTHERVPEGRRADWQRRIGIAQERAYGAQCNTIAAELAMRFEAARDAERTVRYLRLAGAGALARGAYQEGIDHLQHALTALPRLPAAVRPREELDVLLPLGAALMTVQGYASAKVEATYQRALSLCTPGARPDDLERVLRGLWNVAFLRADFARARQIAEQLLGQSETTGNARLAADAHTKLGQTCIHQGDLAPARFHLERALTPSGVDANDPTRLREAPRVAIYLSWALWYTGHPDQALRQAEQAQRLAARAGNPHSSAFALGYASQLSFLCGDLAREIALAKQLSSLSAEHGLAYWRSLADFTQGRAAVHDGNASLGIERMRRAIDEMRTAGGLVGVPYLLCLLAEAELSGGRLADARAALVESARLIAENGNALYAAEGLRLEGELALAEGGPQRREAAERQFVAALTLARRQGSRGLELRAATSLARLWLEGGQAEQAVELLAPLHAAFSEGFDTADLIRAKALLGKLARSSTAKS